MPSPYTNTSLHTQPLVLFPSLIHDRQRPMRGLLLSKDNAICRVLETSDDQAGGLYVHDAM